MIGQYGLREKHFELLKKVLVEPLESVGAKVWVFGSRARGDHREFSDIDLLIEDLAKSYRVQVMKERRLLKN